MKNKIFLILLLIPIYYQSKAQVKYDTSKYYLGKVNIGIDCISTFEGIFTINSYHGGIVLSYQITPYLSLSNTFSFHKVDNYYYKANNGEVNGPFEDIKIQSFNWGANILFDNITLSKSNNRNHISLLYGLGINYTQFSTQYLLYVKDYFGNKLQFPISFDDKKITCSFILGACFIKEKRFRVNTYCKMGVNDEAFNNNVYIPVHYIPGGGYNYKGLNISANIDLLFKLY